MQMLKTVLGVDFRVLHGGNWDVFQGRGCVAVSKDKILLRRDVDPTKVTRKYLEEKIGWEGKLEKCILVMYYLEPNYNIDKGLHTFDYDSNDTKMLYMCSARTQQEELQKSSQGAEYSVDEGPWKASGNRARKVRILCHGLSLFLIFFSRPRVHLKMKVTRI